MKLIKTMNLLGSDSVTDADTSANQLVHNWLRVCAIVLSGIVIVSSAFHFWPFEGSKAWQILCPSNFAVSIWIVLLIVYTLLKLDPGTIISSLPHLSVSAFISINLLSVAFAPDPGRAASYTVKLALILIGAYTLFSPAIYDMRSLKIFYHLVAVAVMISITYCLVRRFGLSSDKFGFHDNAYKYGTYVGVFAPLCASYFLISPETWKIFLGMIISAGALISSGTLGALAAISTGMLAAMIIIPQWSKRFCILGSVIFGIGAMIIISNLNPASGIYDDLKLREKDEINLKQRYIEWQAEVNILEDRTITGTGAGCINDFRSNFYYRLPKLNTLKAFDQNGWLTTGAETGIVGLVCFCWIVLYYGRLALILVIDSKRKETDVNSKFAVANLAGFIAACVANLFSSIHYNGVLIVFVLVLVLISRIHVLVNK